MAIASAARRADPFRQTPGSGGAGIPPSWLDSRLLLGLLLLSSAALFLLSTRQGMGAVPDSFRYLGFGWDMGGDAPLYSWLLLPFSAAGLDPFAAAKWIGLVLMVANTAALWLTFTKLTRSAVASALGTALILASPQYQMVHTRALSEPLFILLSLTAMGLFLRYVETRSRAILIGCGVALALATLARFPAVAFGASMALCLLLWRAEPLRARLTDIAILAIIGVAITGTWVLVSELTVGQSVGRELRFYGNADTERWLQALDSLTALILPTFVPQAFRAAVLLVMATVVGALVYASLRRWQRESSTGAGDSRHLGPFAFGVGAVFYFAFMAFAIVLEANLAFNGRYAAPFYVFAIIAAVSGAAQSQDLRPRWARVGLVAFACVLLLLLVGRSIPHTLDEYANGIGFASSQWRQSPTLHAVAELPAGAAIYTNGPEAIFYVTNRRSEFVPKKFDRRTGIDTPGNSLSDQLEDVRRSMARRPTFIVFLDQVDWRFYLMDEPDLVEILNLQEQRRFADGRIYSARQALGR